MSKTLQSNLAVNLRRVFVAMVVVGSLALTVPVRADGSFTDVDDTDGFSPTGINNYGEMVGQASAQGFGFDYAYIYTPAGGVQDIGPSLNQNEGSAFYGVNDEGVAVGELGTSPKVGITAISWTQAGGVVDLKALGGGYASAGAYAINDSGEIAGAAYTSSGSTEAVVWSPSGGVQGLGDLGGGYSQASGINNNGDVVGDSTTATGQTHGFLWTPSGGMLDLGPLVSGNSEAQAINDNGIIAGWSQNSSGGNDSVYWNEQGQITDLGSLGVTGETYSSASGINDSNQIVGTVQTSTSAQAYLWSPTTGVTIYQGYQITSGGPITEISNASAINNEGEVVGISVEPNANSGTGTIIWSQPSGPIFPSTLSAITTSAPALSWGPVPNAISYDIYRNGLKLANTTSTNFTDSNAPSNSNFYYVTAVFSSGESQPSNGVLTLPAPSGLTAQTPTDQYPSLTWNPADGAVSYSVYQNGSLVGSATSTKFTDSSVLGSGDYAYAITAVDRAGLEGPASSPFAVTYDITPPTVTYSVSPAPTAGGWDNSSATVTFRCVDPVSGGVASGIASCPASRTFTGEGAAQQVTGTTTDNAGNTAQVTATVNIDESAPIVGTASWGTNPTPVGTGTTLTVPASDLPASGASGVAAGEYYVGATDPGPGYGTPMTYASGNLTATNVGATVPVGVYQISYRAVDDAGNWNPITMNTQTYLVVYDPNTTQGMTGKNKKDLVPSLVNGDVMPGLISGTQTDAADYGLTVQYKNGALDPSNAFKFSYATGSNCNKPTASNCHTFSLNATSFAWLIVSGTNNSQGEFQGAASVTVDGVATTNPFVLSGIDGQSLTPAQNDYLMLKVFAPGADPNTATPLYQASGYMAGGNSDVVIK